MTTLYNLRHSADNNFTITKFVDGEVESSYELAANLRECACPAGHRPSCRHRQMAPMMLASGIIDTHYFWDYDLNRAVDFNGMLKSNFDAMEELAAIPGVQVLDINDIAGVHNAIAEAVGEAQHTEVPRPHSPTATTTGFDPVDTGSTPAAVAKPGWRRM